MPKIPTPRRKRKASRSARHSQQAETATGVSSFAIDFGVAVARVNLQLQAVWGECEVGKAQKMKKESYPSANRELKLFTILYSSLFVPYLVWKSRDNGSNSIRDAMCHELERLCRKYAYFEDYFHHTLSQNR